MVITPLLRSQPDVKERLLQLAVSTPRPLLVVQERELEADGSFEKRQPYRYLLEHDAKVNVVIVADQGHEGIWRDPIGELAELHFDDPEDIAGAVSGYLLFRDGLDPTYLKRDLWDPLNDVRALIARLRLEIPAPEKPKAEPERPRFRRAADGQHEDDIETDPGNARARAPEQGSDSRRRKPRPTTNARPAEPGPPPPPLRPEPFAVLGLVPGASEDEVKKAFRALVVQYHPDKVAHLAPEFRALAEEKTRELTSAYEAAQRAARGEPAADG